MFETTTTKKTKQNKKTNKPYTYNAAVSVTDIPYKMRSYMPDSSESTQLFFEQTNCTKAFGSPTVYISHDNTESGSPTVYISHDNTESGSPTVYISHDNTESGSPTVYISHDNTESGSPTVYISHDNTESGSPTVYMAWQHRV